MGRKYNLKYKKGKFLSHSVHAMKADRARLSKNTLERTPGNYALWLSDTRKYDMAGEDTPDYFNQGNGFLLHNPFKYSFRSKKKLGKNPLRENKSYRRYWNGTRFKSIRRNIFKKKFKK